MSSLQELKDVVSELSGVRKMVVVARDGTPLSHDGDKRDKLGAYVAYAAMTVEQMRSSLGFNGPYHMIMEQRSGEKVLALLGEQVILGLDLDAQSSTTAILDRINPVFELIAI
ncbi:MAG: hypothetical protein C0622_05095 [Desulfuromonas sp.]|nr:MAG: hypothetical protein C0622_05095 [Desulfuromonas sp.]